ncbi:Ribosomal RNA large subunit methyltransferase A [hydrothermal vent metagenome]|uniref:Ribosomal RNA large subunit methyltransferase A n=1 Tax=hydrothermal vent metagenome TaxID=652676 RepID=A0A3B0WH32_9ZZZZ
MTNADNLACPIDGLKLVSDNKQWTCPNGHSFDIARQGYVNLLPVQYKRSKHPGDNKEMVVARTHFLDAGIYRCLAKKITETVDPLITDNNTFCFLDAGCGEGYYFNYLYQFLSAIDKSTKLSFIGLDISKEAILQASKRNKNITWVVGTNRQPPLAEASIDLILCVFGFVSFDGFAKILKPNGKMVLVDPGNEHLKELRELIYEKINRTELTDIDTEQFSIVDSQNCKFKTGNIDNENVKNLLNMTPHLFRASKEGKLAVSKLTELDLTVDVVIRTLTKV